jgi:hypothetical protein
MRQKNIITAIIFSLILLIPLPKADAVELGPFDVTIGLCKDVSFVSGVVNAWANATFPVTGTPGFVSLMIQNTNPVITLCDFIVQLSVADNTEAIFLTADKLNDITEQKWDDHLNLMKQTYKIANSVYDFNSGKKREGTVEATSMAADLGTWQRMVTEVSTGNNPQAVKKRQQYDNQVQELANVAHTRAILKEGTTCPEANSNAPDYNAIVDKEFTPRQKTITETETDLNFIRYQLIDLGPRFLTTIEATEKYYDDVQNMLALGVTYKVTEASRNKKTMKPTGKTNPDGTAVRQSVNVPQTIQTFSTIANSQIFADFRTKYEKQYANWASNFWKINADTEGGRETLQSIFKSLSFECNETHLMRGYTNLQADEYERKKIERFKQCQASNQMDLKRAAGLMSIYLDNLKETLALNKRTQGEVWSMESKYLGRQRSVSLDKPGNYYQESVVCAKSPEMIDLELIQTKQAEVNASYNEIIARETVKNAMMRDEEIRRQQQLANDIRLKRKQIEKDHVAEKNATSAPTAPDLGGSF